MDTEYIRQMIIGHFLGNLSDAEKKELFQWLQVDKKNQQLFSEMSDWWAISHVPYFSSRVEHSFQKQLLILFINLQPLKKFFFFSV